MTSRKLLRDVLVPSELKQDLLDGYIRSQTHPTLPLVIYNYTEKVQFERAWTPTRLTCRGLVVDYQTERVLARPFSKFFNYSERPQEFAERLEEFVEVTDKIDGSLGILLHYQGEPIIATRGSFASEQALHATEIYRKRYHGRWVPWSNVTYLFEIVYPANRIVVDYGSCDDLILLGAVNVATGDVLRVGGPACGSWSGPKTQVLAFNTLGEALKAKPRKNAEGIVVRFLGDDVMCKVKQEDYIALHRIVTGLNERTVWEWVHDGNDPDDLFRDIPEEFHDWLTDVLMELYQNAMSRYAKARAEYFRIMSNFALDKKKVDRKKFAQIAVKSSDSPILFAMLDGRDVMPAIWKTLRPEAGLTPMRSNT